MARQQRFNFRKFQRRWDQQKDSLGVAVARTAENHFKDNFRQGGFLNDYLEKWEPRKEADPGRAILVKSGRLKRSIVAEPGSNFKRITVSSDVPYAKRHNEGFGTVPQRKFVGESKALNIKIKSLIRKALDRVFA